MTPLQQRSNSLTQHDYRNHQRGILTDTRQANTLIGHDTPEPVKEWLGAIPVSL